MEPPGSSATEKIILKWNLTASDDACDRMIFSSDREEIDRYLGAVDELQESMSSTKLSDDFSSTESSVLQFAMARLKEEFHDILLVHTSPIETDLYSESIRPYFSSQDFDLSEESPENEFVKRLERQDTDCSDSSSYFKETSSSISSSRYKSTSSIREIDLIPEDEIYVLRCIAERMIAGGFQRECVQLYASVRKPIVDARIRNLKVERLSIDDVQHLQWETLETMISR